MVPESPAPVVFRYTELFFDTSDPDSINDAFEASLIDAEGRGELDLEIDDEAIRQYRGRFTRLRSALSMAARRAGAHFAYVSAGRPVREVARGLAAAGVLEAT